jgi:uncharacterized membrane protein YfcA
VNAGGLPLLIGAGFAAGTVNALAGGGSLISFPALLGAGLGSVPANVTNTVALWPGYLGGALGGRADLGRIRRELAVLAGVSVAGAVGGAVLLLDTPHALFSVLVPWLILTGTLLFAVQPRVARWVRTRGNPTTGGGTGLRLGVFAASVYGAYFGAGLGVILLAVLGLFLPLPQHELNAAKNSLSLSVNTIALVAFALFGPVDWAAVPVMALASLAGGYAGSRAARRMPPALLRSLVVALGLLLTAKLFADG